MTHNSGKEIQKNQKRTANGKWTCELHLNKLISTYDQIMFNAGHNDLSRKFSRNLI